MVTAIGANTGVITCGIFGSVMWWPEAELRSSVETAGIKLHSQDRSLPPGSGTDSPRSAMSKVLRRYFTPSSAVLAQATLEHMHTSGDLQGSLPKPGLDLSRFEDSVDLDGESHADVQFPNAAAAASAAGNADPAPVVVAPETAVEESLPTPQLAAAPLAGSQAISAGELC